ncbi:MAG: tRNA-dihydrouridine synthase [Thermoguttaceae bacterium]|nr:tRNA-dihydrouridine synthase [Thermoguttaceae bacterium]
MNRSAPLLNIGSLSFSPPVMQAALSGYSDAPMRRMAKRFGAPFTLAEVFLDQFVLDVSKKRKARFYLAVKESDHPCGAQVMGSDPDEIVPAALRLVEFGFDLIDLNFACPVPKVLARGRGGALMKDVPRALKIAARVRDALPERIPLTVKLRKSFDDAPEHADALFELLEGLFGLGIGAVTLHGRTVRERYTGVADWRIVRRAADFVHARGGKILGSGDLFSAETVLRRIAEANVDGVAIARGAIGNPWIFREINALFAGEPFPPPPSIGEQYDVIRQHWSLSEELYGFRRASTEMRKFLLKYAEFHPRKEELRMAFVKFKSAEELERIFKAYYETADEG